MICISMNHDLQKMEKCDATIAHIESMRSHGEPIYVSIINVDIFSVSLCFVFSPISNRHLQALLHS